jgi:hypothetical protein
MIRLPDLLRIVGIVAVIEFLLMIGPFPFRAGFDGALMDTALLSAISAPLIYLLVLGKQAQRRGEAHPLRIRRSGAGLAPGSRRASLRQSSCRNRAARHH